MVVDMEVVMVAEMEVDKVVNKVTYEKEEDLVIQVQKKGASNASMLTP